MRTNAFILNKDFVTAKVKLRPVLHNLTCEGHDLSSVSDLRGGVYSALVGGRQGRVLETIAPTSQVSAIAHRRHLVDYW